MFYLITFLYIIYDILKRFIWISVGKGYKCFSFINKQKKTMSVKQTWIHWIKKTRQLQKMQNEIRVCQGYRRVIQWLVANHKKLSSSSL